MTTENKAKNPTAGYSIRGNVFTGVVVSAKAPKTVTIQRELTHYVKKYERYRKVKSKIAAHVPEGMTIKEGDTVTIGETKPLSKTKQFVVISVQQPEESGKK